MVAAAAADRCMGVQKHIDVADVVAAMDTHSHTAVYPVYPGRDAQKVRVQLDEEGLRA